MYEKKIGIASLLILYQYMYVCAMNGKRPTTLYGLHLFVFWERNFVKDAGEEGLQTWLSIILRLLGSLGLIRLKYTQNYNLLYNPIRYQLFSLYEISGAL